MKDKYREISHNNGKYYILDLENQVQRIIKNNEDIFDESRASCGDITQSRCYCHLDTVRNICKDRRLLHLMPDFCRRQMSTILLFLKVM